MNDIGQFPQLTIDQIENLIWTLYQPTSPQVIAETQATLTRLQSSPGAWSVARDLLARSDEKVKFHGALIIIIKLNTESDDLSDSDASELFVNLVGWYLASFRESTSPLVSRKLASALSTFITRFHHLCCQYVSHIVACLASGQTIYPEATSQEDIRNLPLVLDSLEPLQLRAVLWVVDSLTEDASKLDLNSDKNIGLYDVLRNNTHDAVALMSSSLSSNTSETLLREDAVKCLQSWIWFSQKVSARDRHFTEALRPLVTSVIKSLTTEQTPSASIELLIDVAANFSALLTEEHYGLLADLLTGSWSEARYHRLVQGDFDFDPFQFGQLLLAYGEARVDSLIRADDDQSRTLLGLMCSVLSAEGVAAVEDKIYVPALEFWSTYVETLTDEIYSDESSAHPTRDAAVSFALQAVSNGWQRICFVPPEELGLWDAGDRAGFGEARKEFADLLQSIFALTGPQIVFKFSELVTTSLSDSSWLKLEGAAFCLGSLADCIRDETRCDEALSSVFSSPLFSTIHMRGSSLPSRTRQTCVLLVEQYTEYFERNTSLLPPALNLLFGLVGEPSLATPASKSISRLCSSCRHHLGTETGTFLDEYQAITARQKLDCLSTEKILGGISCVVQGLKDEMFRFDAIRRLLVLVEADVTRCLQIARSPLLATELSCSPGFRCLDGSEDEDAATHTGVRVLKGLTAIGRGFRQPNDALVELDSTKPPAGEPESDLLDIQSRIFDIIVRLERTFPASGEVVETICSIFRTGFSESDPGPFVFPPQHVAQYLATHTTQTPRIGAVVSTACSLMSSIDQRAESSSKHEILSDLLSWIIALLKSVSDPENDIELTQNAIEFTSRLVVNMPQVLLRLQPSEAAEFFFLFTLRVLDGKEPLPKAASAEFWTTFMAIKQDHFDMQEESQGVMNTLGPVLASTLVRNIGGHASRSELDRLSEPIKKLVSRYPQARSWLEAALGDPSFPSAKISPEQKAIFIKRLTSLRGSRASNQVIRDFWLAARGSNFAYVS